MVNLENTFIRDPSPSYSEDVISDNGTSTLPIANAVKDNCANDTLKETLNRPPMKRRNTFAFWTLVTLLFILTIGNLLLTITIIGVLRMGKGMQSIELIPEEDIIKFFGITDLDRLYKRDGNIEGFLDEPVTITGDSGSILINLTHRNGNSINKMRFDENGAYFKGISSFEIRDPTTGELIFTTHRPHYDIKNSMESLNAKIISTSRITSSIQNPLKIEANKTSIRGSEGINVDASEIILVTEGKILFNNTVGSTYLNGADGIYLDMDRIPIVNSEHGIRSASIQYKICVCMPQGKLFRLPMPIGHNSKITCAHFNPKYDPCI